MGKTCSSTEWHTARTRNVGLHVLECGLHLALALVFVLLCTSFLQLALNFLQLVVQEVSLCPAKQKGIYS